MSIRAKQSQCLDFGFRIADCGLKTDLLPEAPCALPAQGPNGPPRDEMRETPVSRFHYSIIPVRARRAKQSQFGRSRAGAVLSAEERPTHSLSLRAGSTKSRLCETKPISGGPTGCRGTSRANKANLRPQCRPFHGAIVPNNPKSGAWPTDRCPRGPNRVGTKPISGRNAHHSTIPSFHHSSPMPIVQNKANLAWRGRVHDGRKMRNKPNSR